MDFVVLLFIIGIIFATYFTCYNAWLLYQEIKERKDLKEYNKYLYEQHLEEMQNDERRAA